VEGAWARQLTSAAVEKVLLVSNAYAGSVSARTKEVIVKALEADFKLEVVDTASRHHASELAKDAVDRGFQAVLAFGGDGTINEAAQGLVETDVLLGMLPGGSTNVIARSLGVPTDPVEATAFVASRLRSKSRRRINLGRFDRRWFLFSAGMGLDAEVAKRVESDLEKKINRAEWFFVSNAFKAGLTKYRGMAPGIAMEVDGGEQEMVMTAVCCNGRPFTYFKRFPVDVCPEASLDGRLDVFGLKKLRASSTPRLVWSLFVSQSHTRWRTTTYHHDVSDVRLSSDRLLPVQVDGDYVGERDSGRITFKEKALDLLV
jgi:diacylglycerol kinase family enzyme